MAVRESLSQLRDDTNIDLKNEQLVGVMKPCVTTFFTFQGQPYEQIKDTPMGSPISGYIAEIVLQNLEAVAFETQKPSFWVRYVDDTFAIIKNGRQAAFKAQLNSIYTDIQFTMDEEKDGTLPFLDVLVRRRDNGVLTTSVVRKTTNTLQMLSYKSNHPQAHKRSCVKTLFK